MQRAGYERSTNVSVGRHVRWYLPADLCPRPTQAGEGTTTNEDNATANENVDSEGSAGDGDAKEDDASKGQEEDGDDVQE
eukprot:scaffold34608_cov172-Amphora_coffeaeformis.AAC.12